MFNTIKNWFKSMAEVEMMKYGIYPPELQKMMLDIELKKFKRQYEVEQAIIDLSKKLK